MNTIPYLYVLVHQFQSKVDPASSAPNVPDECRPGGELWLKLINFLNVFDPVQIRYVGSEWRIAVEYVDKIVHLTDTVRYQVYGHSRFCTDTLRIASHRLGTNPHCLEPHGSFLGNFHLATLTIPPPMP